MLFSLDLKALEDDPEFYALQFRAGSDFRVRFHSRDLRRGPNALDKHRQNRELARTCRLLAVHSAPALDHRGVLAVSIAADRPYTTGGHHFGSADLRPVIRYLAPCLRRMAHNLHCGGCPDRAGDRWDWLFCVRLVPLNSPISIRSA